MTGARNHTIDFLKCICIIGVVLHHCSNRRLLPEVREIFSYVAYLTDWCVIGFIGLSGFLEGRKTVASEDWKAYVNRDCKRLLLPFFVLTFIYSGTFQLADLCGFQLRSSVPATFTGKFINTLLCRESGVAEQLYFLPLLLSIRLASRIAIRILPVIFVAITGYILLFEDELHLTGISPGTCLLGMQAYILGLLASNNAKYAIVMAIATGLFVGLKVHNWQIIVGLLLSTIGSVYKLEVPLCNLVGSAAGTIFAYHTPVLLQSMILGISFIHGAPEQCIAIVIVVSMLIVGIALLRRKLHGCTTGFSRIMLF
jgi:hypothetical protein